MSITVSGTLTYGKTDPARFSWREKKSQSAKIAFFFNWSKGVKKGFERLKNGTKKIHKKS
ncbi:hypothetical protein HY994_00035 [Candidatus Micrarchaeota archaeon]|nr:hypothetical protein [Candidatus Micrarchaeota archaeon]